MTYGRLLCAQAHLRFGATTRSRGLADLQPIDEMTSRCGLRSRIPNNTMHTRDPAPTDRVRRDKQACSESMTRTGLDQLWLDCHGSTARSTDFTFCPALGSAHPLAPHDSIPAF